MQQWARLIKYSSECTAQWTGRHCEQVIAALADRHTVKSKMLWTVPENAGRATLLSVQNKKTWCTKPPVTAVYKKVSYRKQNARRHSWYVDPVKLFLLSNLITMQTFGRFSYCVRACRRSKSLGDAGPILLGWDADVADPLRNMVLPHLCNRAKFGHSTSNHTSVIMETGHKIWLLTSRLPRSLNIIGTDTDRSDTYSGL